MVTIPLIDTKAGNIPSNQNPEVFNDFVEIFNALQILQRELSQVTRIACVFDETVTAGQAVSIYNVTGVVHARLANATDSTRQCYGFAPLAVTSGSAGEVRGFGMCNALTGLTPGTMYYLSTTSGTLTATRPAAAGNIIQAVGWALDPNQILFNPSTLFIQL